MSDHATTLTITLPLPAKGLSPNSRMHYMGKARLKKQAKRIAQLRTREALNPWIAAGKPLPTFTRYRLAFHFATNRNRDDDNAKASCKAFRDGIALALGVDDSSLRDSFDAELLIDRNNPRLELTLIP